MAPMCCPPSVFWGLVVIGIDGAQDSTSARCVLGTSSRVLRMLTESGDVIRYVFLLSAGLGPLILDVGGGGEPVFSSWEFVRLGDG